MTISIPSPIPESRAVVAPATTTHRTRRRRAGFTLVELMFSAGLAAIILAGVLSTFLFMGRSGANLQNYSDMESQARRALELFAADTRQASTITWGSRNSITLTVNAASITYSYTANTFTRTVGGTATTLVTGIEAPVARTSDADTACTPFFRGYSITGTEIKTVQYSAPTAAELASANNNTKQLQISFRAVRRTRTVTTASDLVLSARYILRNKIVTA